MLTIIIVSSKIADQVAEYNWNLENNSSPLSILANDGVEIGDVDKVFVHATNKELEFILENFKNLPCRINGQFQSWSGDDAMFIILNMM